MSSWIKTKERLPESSGSYLGITKCGTEYYITDFDYSVKHKKFNAYDNLDIVNYPIDVVYWQPLPELPEELKRKD